VTGNPLKSTAYPLIIRHLGDLNMALLKIFVLYAGIGVIGTAGHFSMLFALVSGLAVNASIATCLGFMVGAFINYALNYQYTFQSDKQHLDALPKFLTIAAVGFCLNGFIMIIGTESLNYHYLIVQILATLVILVWGFIGNYLWTFKN